MSKSLPVALYNLLKQMGVYLLVYTIVCTTGKTFYIYSVRVLFGSPFCEIKLCELGPCSIKS